MKNFFLTLALLLASIQLSYGAGNIHKSIVLINGDIELTVEVIDVATACKSWGYHYGEIVNFKSRSLSNSPYNFTFNVNIYSALGNGNGNYGGNYNLTSTSKNLMDVTVFNNGKEVNYKNLAIQCEDLTTDNINLIKVQLNCWGSVQGTFIGDFTSTLPVELLSFDATASRNQVDLSWVTGSEKNNDFFTIERTVDGLHFEEIGKVAGQGNSSIQNEYTFTDVRPKSGVSYYRLSQTDYNGESEYFEVKSVNIQKGEFVSNVYPNPAVMNRTTVFVEKTGSIVTLNIRNVLGQLISSKTIDATNEDVAAEIELNSSEKMYFVEIVQNNAIQARHKVLNN